MSGKRVVATREISCTHRSAGRLPIMMPTENARRGVSAVAPVCSFLTFAALLVCQALTISEAAVVLRPGVAAMGHAPTMPVAQVVPSTIDAIMADSRSDSFYQSVMKDIDEITEIARKMDRMKEARDLEGSSTPDYSSPPPADRVRLDVAIKCDLAGPEDAVLLLGSGPELGDWNPVKAIELARGDEGMWTADLQVQPSASLEFKLAIRRKGISKDATPEWEVLAGGKNRRLTTGKEGSDASISASWGSLEVIPPLRRAAKEPAIAQAAPAQAAPAPAPAAKAAQAPAPSATAAKSTAVVHFRVKCETALGEQVMVVGGPSELGAWGDKGMVLTTNAEWYPWWEGEVELCVGGGQVPEVRYKYVVKGPQGDKWEDAIADRTVACDAKSGILGEGLTTFIDDGEFNMSNRACTYVRKGQQQGKGGMELVSADQIKQWAARTKELEGEVLCLKGRITKADEREKEVELALETELEERGEMQIQLDVVQQVITRMRNLESQVNELCKAKTLMLQKVEKLNSENKAASGCEPPYGSQVEKQNSENKVARGELIETCPPSRSVHASPPRVEALRGGSTAKAAASLREGAMTLEKAPLHEASAAMGTACETVPSRPRGGMPQRCASSTNLG